MLFLSFLLISLSANSQNWNKFFVKGKDAYIVGDYAKADKQISKVIKKSRKKLGEENAILANALIQKAKINLAYGVFVGVPESTQKAIQMSEQFAESDQLAHAMLLMEATGIYIQYGHFVLADQTLKSAEEWFVKSGNVDVFQTALTVAKASILAGKGFYAESIRLVNDELSTLDNLLISADKNQKTSLLDQYADLIVIKANAFRNMGDFQRSDSAFVSNDKWMDDNLDKGNLHIARNKYLNAKLLQENGLSTEAQVDMFEDAYTDASRKHLPSHWQLIQINQDLMNVYLKTGQNNRYKILENDFNKLLNTIPSASVYTRHKDLQTVYYNLENENFSTMETRINRILKDQVYPQNLQIRIDLYEFANELALLYGQHRNTEAYQTRILAIKKELYGDNSPIYHLTNIKLANYYIDYADKFDEVKDIYEKSFWEIVNPEITTGHVMYLDILNHLAKYYEETDQYGKASEALEDALIAARRKYDNRDIEYGRTLNKIAALEIKIGQYEKAREYLTEAESIFKEVDSDLAKSYKAVAMVTKAKLKAIEGEFDEAEELMYVSDELKKEGAATTETVGLDYQDDLAALYLESGRLLEANEILQSSLKKKTIEYGPESRHLNQSLILLSKLNLLQGEYAEAERYARKANDIMTGIFGGTSTKVVPSMQALANVYSTIGDYEKAEAQLQQALSYQKREFGNIHVDVGKSISELAMVKFYQQAPLSEITRLFEEAEQIIGMKLGKENPTYAMVLRNLAVADIAAGEYDKAFDNLAIAGKIWNKKIGKRNNINAAGVEVLKGDIYYRMGEYSRADNRYVEALDKYQKFFSDTHPEYVKVQSKLAKTYYMNGDWRRALNQIDEVLSKYRTFLAEYFPALSEREKAKYWNTIKPDYEFFNTLIVSKNRNDKYIGELYNNALITKSLLLNSSIKIRQQIMNSENTELKNTYNAWIAKKELLTSALSMTREQLTENGIDQAKLSNEVESLEKELSLKSEAFGQNYEQKPVTWQDVQGVLGANEVAIEMIRFRVFEKDFTDSVKYALLYVTGEKRAKPQMILLENGDDLENKYLKYYRNSIKYQIKDTKSYEAYWKPIIDEIGTVATIYLSPDGVYNQINLEAIPIPEPNKYVIDNSNIILISNTKDLYLKKDEKDVVKPGSQLIATMFGDPVFHIQTNRGAPVRASGISRETAVVISQLPGTKKEIEEVKGYLSRNGWQVQEFAELDAREEIVKTIASPRIFHVATHGFFQEEKTTANVTDQELYQNYLYENPLLKSGLLLSGAGDILNTTKYNYNIDNGILTAYEAMNLNLDQTELVVLSACETGLGEMEAGEGVYGLQRSFLVAGAKSVVMSLFKVSDDVTQQLMVRFYQKWLETGDKRQAFTDAKKEIRNEYPDPIYWGPFVMIGTH